MRTKKAKIEKEPTWHLRFGRESVERVELFGKRLLERVKEFQ